MARDLLPLVKNALEGRYAIEKEIGRGGAARVFLGLDPAGTTVAVKVLHPQLSATVTADRFLREIKVISRLEHPRIARLIDFGEVNWLLWYVMEFLPGPTLKQHLARVRRVSISDTIRIAHDLLSALGAAHALAIVHRDVKPDNVVLTPNGASLLDFGIAKAVAESSSDRLTRSGFAVGTSAYMSPEQIEGANAIDPRSDLYSLACVLFECLAGHPPFDDPMDETVMAKHQNAAIPDLARLRADAPPALVEAIVRALAKAPGQRWASAEEMRAALPALAPA